MGKHDFDYIIIGSGPAGRRAAKNLAKAHKRVAIAEMGPLGGAEINTRDLPYQIALDFANTYHKLMASPAAGHNSHHFNFPTLTNHIDTSIKKTSTQIKSDLEKLDIKILTGFAHFISDHTIAVDDQEYTASNFILATGSKLKVHEIAGLDSVEYMTPDDALKIRRLPKYIFIVGGGTTGTELAEFFANLGVGVIIMERGPHLLPREDEDIADILAEHLTSNLGVNIITNAKVLQITEDHMSKIVIFMSGSGKKMVRVDSIIIATGSEPFLDYSLENAGVDYKKSGIIVDKYFGTSAKNIFAIGDSLGSNDSSTERAQYEADILTENLLHRSKTSPKYSSLIRAVHTHPAIATLGLNELSATAHDQNYKKSTTIIKNNLVKTLTNRSGHFIGSTVIAENADLALEIHKLLTK